MFVLLNTIMCRNPEFEFQEAIDVEKVNFENLFINIFELIEFNNKRSLIQQLSTTARIASYQSTIALRFSARNRASIMEQVFIWLKYALSTCCATIMCHRTYYTLMLAILVKYHKWYTKKVYHLRRIKIKTIWKFENFNEFKF